MLPCVWFGFYDWRMMHDFAVSSKLRLAGCLVRGNNTCRAVAGACLGLLLTGPLVAAGTYLEPGHPDGVTLLAPPPVAGSAEDAADLNTVRTTFKNRTPVEEARADSHDALSLFAFRPAVGPLLAPGKLPK